MLLVNTGPLVAYINRKDPDHEACAALFDARTDIADASVVALAERLGIREVATLDHRHFRAIRPRHCAALTLLP